MLSPNLEKTLHRALALANERRHEYATLEHLLLALGEDGDAIAVMRACGVDLDKLKAELGDYIDNELANLINISEAQLSHITDNDKAGIGLLKYAGSIVPFEDDFPHDTKLYKLMTTRINEK